MKWLFALVCAASMATAGVQRQFEQAQTVNVMDDKRLTVTVDYAQTKIAILTQTAVAKATPTWTPSPNKNSPTPTATFTPTVKGG